MCVIRQNDKPLVEDLFLDLRDGEVLLSLLEILTAQQYVSNVCLASRWPSRALLTSACCRNASAAACACTTSTT